MPGKRKFDPERLNKKIEDARLLVSLLSPFWSTMLSYIDFDVEDLTDSYGYTNGVKIVLSSELDQFGVDTIAGIIIHELMHISYMHFARGHDKIQILWNVAADIVVNSHIMEFYAPKVSLPPHVLIGSKFVDKSVEEVYSSILKDFYRAFGNDPEGVGDEEIEEWIKKEFGKYMLGDTHIEPENSDEVVQKVTDILVEAYEGAEMVDEKWQGNLPGDLVEFVKKLTGKEINWKRILYQYLDRIFSKEDYSPLPPSRKYLPYDLYAPSLRSEDLTGRIVIAIDTSGSMSKREIGRALGEIDFVSQFVEEIFVIFHDYVVQEVLKPHSLREFVNSDTIKVRGRGGTSHLEVFRFIEENNLKPDLFIGITDGFSEYPRKEPPYPVLWVLTKDHEKPPWGTIIFDRL